MSTQKSLQFWTIVLLGLFYISVQCDARAVNVSNTWTMPQEGLNVFYRFFRDRISWFEADAVCQFHHANLVTVDNSFQFDATRDLLRELDVNDIVWIGLMRPQSSERFMWSNSRPLVTDTGYWAESLPLMDAPLCAVIDPIRDYRWHALRCGGPETASFLCEMPVPSWADACILKDMPNLTMQYMADTASIELIRNCEEEGLLRQTCKGKQDRERALRELICPRERLEAQRINDITNSHFKSLQIINSIRTDNNENNNIELLPLGQNYEANNEQIPEQLPTEKNTVQRLIEQFNVDELMQADEPLTSGGFQILGDKPMPVKKAAVAAKRTILIRNYPRKSNLQSQTSQKPIKKPSQQQLLEPALEDMMMGDQAQHNGEPEILEHGKDDDDVSNEIMEPLPHKKKILPQDLKTMATITERPIIAGSEESKEIKSSILEEKGIERKQQQVNENERTTTAVTEVSTTAASAASSTTNATPTTTTTTTSTTTTTTTTAAPSSSSTTTTVRAISTTLPTTVVTSEEPVSLSSTAISSSIGVSSPSTITTTTATDLTPKTQLPNSTNFSIVHDNQQQSTMGAPATETATLPSATIGHPMHPQQPRSNIITEETQHPHIKESADNSHFIPPMLLVKSHYVPPAKHEHEHEHEQEHGHEQHGTTEYHGSHHDSDISGDGEDIGRLTAATTTTTTSVVTSTETDGIKQQVSENEQLKQQQSKATATASAKATTMERVTVYTNVPDTVDVAVTSTTMPIANTATTNSEVVTAKDTHASIIDASSSSQTKGNDDITTKIPTTILKPVNILENNKSKIEILDETSVVTTTTTTMPVTTTAQIGFEGSNTKTSTIKSVPSATTTTTEGSSVVSMLLKETENPINVMPPKVTNEQQLAVETAAATTTTKTILAAVAEIQAEVAAGIVGTLKMSHDKQEMIIITTTDSPTTTTPTTTTITTTTAAPITTTKHAPIKATTKHAHAHVHTARKPTKATHIRTTTEEPATTHNFLNEETEPPFKPNRHRELTQPETVSYFKKILG